MKKSSKDLMYAQIVTHGQNLNRIFNLDKEPIALCKALRRIELKAERLATDYCNGVITCERWEVECERIKAKVLKIIPNVADFGFFVNGDPRGYALKIENGRELDIYSDWGGYGILAPDFTPVN